MPYTAPQEAWESEVDVRGDVNALATLIAEGGALVLTGAGISTDSGIPDYRGPTSAARRHAPMTYDAFVGDPVARHRYWARSHVGWPQIAGARPNAGHRAVASLQRAGLLHGVITQNVDGLHQAAGARDVVELHGALDRVVCLGCRAAPGRREVQQRLTALNPGFGAPASAINPDGDAELPDAELDRFTMAACPACGDGPLKPDVVFFGESVPRPRVDHCFALVEGARSLVVLGSSLTVMSGLRFVHAATRRGLPVAVVTAGPSRADAVATVRLTDRLGEVLPAVLDTLGLPDRA
ncbi:NAD-dependent protein deacetylase [Actinomycetospora straminea]|uniref:NAD-dependent protein deacetylase n=1 Tax=Actinomycetospora straminea TaxID=663607 RepID=A0ABP9EQZ4_9PSEU|nr:NAD-dependent protein deacetylase [Actinomycetospora straminea]MDD7934038.1 NAD-dependent protein deacetylase [Actinomycetospora straminea]